LNRVAPGCILFWTRIDVQDIRGRLMHEGNTGKMGKMVFAQLMAHGSRHVLDRCIRRYDGNRGVRSFSCRDQYLAMTFAQLT